jgi:hypothetical protein
MNLSLQQSRVRTSSVKSEAVIREKKMVEIKLDLPEKPTQEIKFVSNEKLIAFPFGENLKLIHGHTGGNVIAGVPASPLIQAIHQAYALHYPISLKPEVLWYCISYEIAKHIRLNPHQYKNLFNGDPNNKKTIEVRDDTLRIDKDNKSSIHQWYHTLEQFYPLLEEHIPQETMWLLLPELASISDRDSDSPDLTNTNELALLISFMDAASPYFSYQVRTLCGIPRIRLEGTKEDWQILAEKMLALSVIFKPLECYFHDLHPIFCNIVRAFEGEVNEEFWTSIYKKNGGSGGPYISGWITAFVAHVKDKQRSKFDWKKMRGMFGGLTNDAFPLHISCVDFKWQYYTQELPMSMIGGITNIEVDNGYLTPSLGIGIVEKKGE